VGWLGGVLGLGRGWVRGLVVEGRCVFGLRGVWGFCVGGFFWLCGCGCGRGVGWWGEEGGGGGGLKSLWHKGLAEKKELKAPFVEGKGQ